MAPTFYGVLGVGPDADADAIERGYRERVTAVHPDVNDDPDADAQFQRLTTARDTLLDTEERSRYDRLGHASYVRHHVSCSAWAGTVSEHHEESGERSASDRRRETSKPGATGQSRGRDWNTGRNRDHDRGHGSASAASSSGPSRGGSRRTGAPPDSGSTGSGTGRGESSDASARQTTASRASDGGRSSRRRSGDRTRGSASGESTYASSSFWESQRVGQRSGGRADAREPLTLRLFRGVRALGVWALIHVVFLAAAVGTSWYVYAVVLDASTASLPLLVVLVGEVVLAGVLSSVHVATRIYR